MNYDEIMKSITQGLTGDFDTDRQYLMNQMGNYKDHDLGKEIVRACGRLLYSILQFYFLVFSLINSATYGLRDLEIGKIVWSCNSSSSLPIR